MGIWGRISDRRGHAFALKASIWFFAGETLLMAFAAPQSYHIFIPIAFLIASIANAGFIVAVFNRRYELIPESNRIIYDNFYTAAIGVATILGPLLGGVFKGALYALLLRLIRFGLRVAKSSLRLLRGVSLQLLSLFFRTLDRFEYGQAVHRLSS